MVSLYRVPLQNNQQYTLSTQLAQGGATAILNSDVSAIVQTPGVFVVDRVDSSGNKTPSVREYISFTGVSTTNLTGLTRGLAGSTNQVHNVGAIVEFVPDVTSEDAWYNVFTTEHGITGQHLSLASVSGLNSLNQILASSASGNFFSMRSLNVASLASLQQAVILGQLTASGASLLGVNPLIPTWVFAGTLSGATVGLGRPIDMPQAGTIQFITAITRAGSSNASLFLDITKNGTSIINATASTSYLQIPINGTFISTASAGAKTFVAGDVFNFSTLNTGSFAQDLTVKFYAR